MDAKLDRMSGSQRSALASQIRRGSAPGGGASSSRDPARPTNSTQCATTPRSSHQRLLRYLRTWAHGYAYVYLTFLV
jgi:hypothetical protein